VFSSILAAVTDVSNAIGGTENIPPASAAMGIGLDMMSNMVSRLNVGYIWMFVNCLMSAAYVRCFAPVMSLS
jgi:GDP-mannose transporter